MRDTRGRRSWRSKEEGEALKRGFTRKWKDPLVAGKERCLFRGGRSHIEEDEHVTFVLEKGGGKNPERKRK